MHDLDFEFRMFVEDLFYSTVVASFFRLDFGSGLVVGVVESFIAEVGGAVVGVMCG